MVERKSRYSLFEKLANKKASTVAEAMIRRLRAFKTRSLTYDNGLEFAKHLEVGRELGAISALPIMAGRRAWSRITTASCGNTIRRAKASMDSTRILLGGLKRTSMSALANSLNTLVQCSTSIV